MIEVTNAKVDVAKDKLKEARTRKRLFLSSRFFGGTIPSGKPLGKPRSLSELPILISFHDLVGERVIEGPKMIEVTNEKVVVAKEKLKEARTRQKSYADKHHRSLEFQPSGHVFLKVSPARGVRRFEGTSIILFMSFHIRSIRSVRI
nr:putative nucleotidyltransferase, ribonuclease H [Tanacetum cinerariifolium]